MKLKDLIFNDEEPIPYGKLRENHFPHDYSDLHHVYGGAGLPTTKSGKQEYHTKIFVTLTNAQRMLGPILDKLPKETRFEYLKAEQEYRDIVYNLLLLDK